MILLFALVGIAAALLVGLPVGAVLGSLESTAKSLSSANTSEKYMSLGLDELFSGSRFRKSSKKGLGRLETKG